MQPLQALAPPVLGPPPHHVQPVRHVDLEQLAQPEHSRLPVDQGHVVDAEGLLHRRQPVKLGQHGVRVKAAAHLDDQVQAAVAVGQVLQVGDAVELLGLDQVLDPGHDLLRADRVGQLGDHDPGTPRGQLLHHRRGPAAEDAPAGLVGLPDTLQAHDPPAGGQVRPGHEPHQGIQGRGRVPDQMPRRGDDLDQVVRRHVGGHPDRDAGRAVDQEVRYARGQHVGLGLAAVVVRHEVDGVLVDGGHHLHGRRGQPRLGVPHGRRLVVAAQAAEVPVPVHQRQPHRPGLRHPGQRVVDGRVAVRVQAAHDLADHAGALHVGPVRAQAHLVHLVQDPPLDRLQAVPRVGQRPGVDDAVGVFEVTAAHLLGDVDVDDVLFEFFGGRGSTAAAPWGHDVHSAASAGLPRPTPRLPPTWRRSRRPRTASAR